MDPDLFTCGEDKITWPIVKRFVVDAMTTRLQAESRVVEFKSKLTGESVVQAVAALANTDGGLIFVGVNESGGETFPGIDRSDIDRSAQQIRALAPGASIDFVPVAVDGSSTRAVIVVRVNADASERPVVLKGRVLMRGPGQTIGASRQEIRDLFSTPSGGTDPTQPIAFIDIENAELWSTAQPFAAEFRVHLRFLLPLHTTRLRVLGSGALDAVEDSLDAGPMPSQLRVGPASSHHRPACSWRRVTGASLRVRFEAGELRQRGPFQPDSTASVLIQKSSRILDVVVCIGVKSSERGGGMTEPSDIREALLMALTSARTVGKVTADGMHANGPLVLQEARAWIGGDPGLQSVALPRNWRTIDSNDSRQTWTFASRTFRDGTASELLGCVDSWLTEYFFDRGASHFEDLLRGQAVPEWFMAQESEVPRDRNF